MLTKTVVRPKVKLCQSCEVAKDFIANLQNEIQRLKNVTDDLHKQIVQAGGTPEIPEHLKPGFKQLAPDGKTYLPPFKNICPGCSNFKTTQRPGSAGRIRANQQDFRIRKSTVGRHGPKKLGSLGTMHLGSIQHGTIQHGRKAADSSDCTLSGKQTTSFMRMQSGQSSTTDGT